MSMMTFPIAAVAAGVMAMAVVAGCGDAPKLMTRAELMDPAACKDCHPQQFSDWSGSMHAYAGEDPVFLAMNQRGQRETNGALGDFCVKCHAPVALAEGLTTDGLNLTSLDSKVKGVTCFFCHSAASVEGSHNNPLKLAKDGTLFGPFGDPVAGTPHRSKYAALFDPSRTESAAACGSCHDIQTQHGANVERTFAEWQESRFSNLATGLTCVRCHMDQSQGPASTASTNKIRTLGSHRLPGVDVALTDFPSTDAQRHDVQSLLDDALLGTLCLTNTMKIEVNLENIGAGHSIPSGSGPDRRLWAEVTAFAGADTIYSSGIVPAGQTIETTDDPDLWLIRDCVFDEAQSPVHMFWEAASFTSNLVPASVTPVIQIPETYVRSHVRYVYPRTVALTAVPDRMTLRVFMKPIGDEILQDLVGSGDLDPAIAAGVPQFELAGAHLEWTAAKATSPTDSQSRTIRTDLKCVTNSPQFVTIGNVASSNRRCVR